MGCDDSQLAAIVTEQDHGGGKSEAYSSLTPVPFLSDACLLGTETKATETKATDTKATDTRR